MIYNDSLLDSTTRFSLGYHKSKKGCWKKETTSFRSKKFVCTCSTTVAQDNGTRCVCARGYEFARPSKFADTRGGGEEEEPLLRNVASTI